VVGFASGEIQQLPANLPLLKGASIMGVFWGSFSEREPHQNQQNIQQLMEWMLTGKIKQHIHQVYPLQQSAQALRDLMERKVIGKAVVTV
jgi:NADPH2:quinone reductase